MLCVVVMLVQDMLSKVVYPWHVKPLLVALTFTTFLFHFILYYCSTKSCLRLSDLNHLKMYYYMGDQVVTEPPSIKYCNRHYPHVFNAIDFHKRVLCPRFPEHSLKTWLKTHSYVRIILELQFLHSWLTRYIGSSVKQLLSHCRKKCYYDVMSTRSMMSTWIRRYYLLHR